MSVNVVILAAGQGTRMNSDRPKVLHEIAAAPLLVHAMRAGLTLAPERLVVVAGVGFEEVAEAATTYWPETTVVRQEEQLGTGHAVLCAADALTDAAGDTLVLYNNTPFITENTLSRMAETHARADIVVLGFESQPKKHYGQLVTNGNNLLRIVE